MKTQNFFCSSLIFLLSTNSLLLSQTTFERTYGGIYSDSGRSIIETADQGYVILATANSFSGNNTNAAYVIRTDASGDTLWTKIIRGEGNDVGVDIQHASDGGYVLAIASSSVNPDRSYDIYFVKIDDAGNTLWSKTYGGSDLDYVHSMTTTKDGGYALLAHTFSFGNGGSDFYLVRVDQAGDTLWTKTYGGSEWDWGSTVQQTEDDGFILVGETKSLGDSDGDVYLIKTDSVGQTQWRKIYGGPEQDRGFYVIQTDDKGYMVVGITASYGAGNTDCYVIRTDSNGDSLWTRTFGGVDEDFANAVQQTSDGNYVFIGGVSAMGFGKIDAHLVKFSPDGNMLWEKFFGGVEQDWWHRVLETTDGGFALVGRSESFIAGNGYDIYLVKTDGAGNVTSVRGENSKSYPELFSLNQNYPNPFNPQTTIVFDLPISISVTLEIFDVKGRSVATLLQGQHLSAGVHKRVFDATELTSGLYYYRISAGEWHKTAKMLLLK